MSKSDRPQTPPPSPELKMKLERIGDVLTNVVTRMGFDTDELARRTGFTTGFIRGIMNATQWSLPSRQALRFMFDVMGVDTSTPDIVEILGYATNRGQAAGRVKVRMAAFYGRTPGRYGKIEAAATEQVPSRVEELGRTPLDALPTADTLPLVRRQEAVDSVIESLVGLIDVGWEDVIAWLEANGPSLVVDRRDAVMRAIWSA